MAATLRLQSSEGKFYDVDVEAAKQSTTIKTMLEDLGLGDDPTDQVIPVANVRSVILEKVIDWSVQHKDDPEPTDDDDFKFFETKFEDLSKWDQDFILALDQPTLFELTLAANYLEVKGLLNLTCKGIANLINGKSVAEIRTTFNVKPDHVQRETGQRHKHGYRCAGCCHWVNLRKASDRTATLKHLSRAIG